MIEPTDPVRESLRAPYAALIVDYGGVLTTPLQDAMARFAESAGINLEDLVRVALAAYAGGDDQLVTDFETGRISEEEFCRTFAARLSEATGVVVEPEGLVGRLFGGVALEEEMLGAVEAVHGAGFKTALLSNSWGLAFYPVDRFSALFDVVVISGEVGLRKPDPKIFELVVERLGEEASRCIFVDDHPGHLQAAGAAGMTTVLHRSPAATIAELEKLLETDLRVSGS